MSSDRRFFSGNSLAQALAQAAQHFQMPPADINYKLVEKKHGFLKVRRKVVIEVDGAEPGRAPAATAASAPRAAASSASPEAASPEAASPAAESPAAESSVAESPVGESSVAESPVAEPPVAESSVAESSVAESPVAEPSAAAGSSTQAPAESSRGPRPKKASRRASRRGPRRMRDAEGAEADTAKDRKPAPQVELPATMLPAKKRFPGARGEEAEAAGNALARILDLAGVELESEILQGDEELVVELWGRDQDILLRDRGRLLLAIQHLLPRVIRGLIGRSVVCRVDSDDFHMIREERLRDLAQRAADEVRHRGRPKTLEPMSPDERRIVHLTLADYPGVETESHGSGLFKRVMVRASRGERPKD